MVMPDGPLPEDVQRELRAAVDREKDPNVQRSLNDRLIELDRKVELLMQMVCPVCGPAIHAQNHPDKVAFTTPVEHHPDHNNGTG